MSRDRFKEMKVKQQEKGKKTSSAMVKQRWWQRPRRQIKTKADCGEKNKGLIQEPLSHTHFVYGDAEAESRDWSARWASEVGETEPLQRNNPNTQLQRDEGKKEKTKYVQIKISNQRNLFYSD